MLKGARKLGIRPTVKRASLIGISVAVVLVLVLVNLSFLPTAYSYAPATFEPDAHAKPTVTVKLDAKLQDPEATPAKGTPFTYDGTIDYQWSGDPGVTDQMTVTFAPSWLGPVTGTLTENDFQITQGSGTISGFETETDDNGHTTYATFVVENIGHDKDLKIHFSASAKISDQAGKGAVINGSLNAEVGSTVKELSLSGDDNPGFTPDNAGYIYDCSGTMHYTYKVDTGGWLVDLKFADALGQGKVKSDRVMLENATVNSGAKNSIKIVDAKGVDQTASVLEKMDHYDSNDASKPYRTSANTGKYPNARWTDSLNWKYDPSTFTGDTWLDAGTTIEINRHVSYGNCVGPGYSTDLSVQRPLAVNLAIARPNVTVSGHDNSVIQLPGTPTVAGCDAMYAYADAGKGNGAPVGSLLQKDLKPGKVVPLTELQSGPLNIHTEGAAVSGLPGLKGKHYYFDRTEKAQQLWEWDESKASNGFSPVGGKVPGSDGFDIISGAIDAQGRIWAVGSRSSQRDYTPIVYMDLTKEQKTWVQAGRVHGLGSSQHTDVAFDGEGNLLVLNDDGAAKIGGIGNKHAKYVTKASVYSVSAEALAAMVSSDKKEPVEAHQRGVQLQFKNGGGSFYGLAVGNDGTIYISSNTSIYAADLESGTFEKRANFPSKVIIHHRPWPFPDTTEEKARPIHDLASCAFLPSKPEFQVQKSVVDPVTKKVQVAGEASKNRLTLDGAGRGYVDYLVTVSNIGSKEGNPGTIEDRISFPQGFNITDVELDGKSQGATQSLSLMPGDMEKNSFKQYRVRVHLQADPNADWYSAGECYNKKAGIPDKGLFNSVDMMDDADGSSNNDACVPVKPKPKAHLKLVKKIEDASGKELPDSPDKDKFNLVAGAASGTTSLLFGTTGSSDVDKDVFPGAYLLDEVPVKDQSGVTGTYREGTWSCKDARTQENRPVSKDTIKLSNGDSVVCTITNTRHPKFHVEKFAVHQDSDNPHIGEAVDLDPEKLTGMLEYKIAVTSDSDFVGDTGAVSDHFRMPKGLIADNTKEATIKFDSNGTSAEAKDLRRSASVSEIAPQSDIADGVTLASSISNLPAKGKVYFTVSIPVKADMKGVSGHKFADNAEKLGTCTGVKEPEWHVNPMPDQGAINAVSLEDENLTYSKIPILDNYACIPVKMKPRWKVEKAAIDANDSGLFNLAWADAGTTAPSVKMDQKNGTYQATVFYRVRVTNDGTVPAKHPEITDQLTLPEGFKLVENDGLLLIPDRFSEDRTKVDYHTSSSASGSGSVVDFTIPKGNETLNPGKSATYVYQVTVSTVNDGPVDWANAGECQTTGGGQPGKGLFNKVAMEGDADGEANNDSCIPVHGKGKAITIIKKDGGDLELNGAEFKLYPDENGKPGAEPVPGNDPIRDAHPEGKNRPDQSGPKFKTTELEIGKTYWLKETRAPYARKQEDAGYSLLAEPIRFTPTDNGIQVIDSGGFPVANGVEHVWEITDGNKFEIVVHDPRTAELPKAGGHGLGLPTVIGLLLVVGGVVETLRRNTVRYSRT